MSELKTSSGFLTRVAINTSTQMAADTTLIPKEELTAYQRWELPSFSSAPPAAQTAALALSTAAELQQIKQLAHEQGYAEGKSSGHTAGYESGYAAGTQLAQDEVTVIHELMQNFNEGMGQLDQNIAQALVDMSVSIARKMVVHTVEVKPELILELVRAAISNLPQFNQNPHLILHPADAELVHKHMNDELNHAGWKIFTDSQIKRGGCLVKTAHSLIDATIEARWDRVLQSIGQDGSWLA